MQVVVLEGSLTEGRERTVRISVDRERRAAAGSL